MSSLVKFYHQRSDDRARPLWWGRADVDGAPFRGEPPPPIPEAEYDRRVVRVRDFRWGKFYLHSDADMARYADVCDRAVNQWFTIVSLERFRRDEHGEYHYVEWVMYHMEDGAAGASPRGFTEVRHGGQ